MTHKIYQNICCSQRTNNLQSDVIVLCKIEKLKKICFNLKFLRFRISQYKSNDYLPISLK